MSELANAADGQTPEVAELRQALRNTQRQLAKANARTGELIDAVYQAAKDASLAHGTAKVPPRPARDRRKASDEVALVHTTDWQHGKITGSYNSDIAHARLAGEMTRRIERLVELHREACPVRSAHYMLGGDMVEGVGIFPGQAYAVDATLYDQLFGAANTLEAILLHALSVFETVDVWDEKGNHGRLGKRGEYPSGDNIDLIMYRIVRERFRHEPRIRWHPLESPGIWNQVTIGDYKVLLAHGDEIKSFGGNTPAFGILRKVTKWAVTTRRSFLFDDAYLGHFHTPMTLILPDGGQIFMTGSPESGNEYAMEFMAESGEPSQRLNFVDPAKGRVTAEYKIRFEA